MRRKANNDRIIIILCKSISAIYHKIQKKQKYLFHLHKNIKTHKYHTEKYKQINFLAYFLCFFPEDTYCI